MKRIISLLLCLLCVLAWASYGVAETNTQLISATIDGASSDRVHLRASPSAKAASLGLYFTGTPLLCEADSIGEWAKVIIGAESGYIKSEFLRRGEDQQRVHSKLPLGKVKTTSWVNLRSAPSLDEEIVGKLLPGDTVTIYGETASHWYYVQASGTVGYASAKYISMTDAVASPNATAPEANLSQEELKQYRLVLNNDAPFLHVPARSTLYLGQLNGSFDDLPVTFTQFAVADVDADGRGEVMVKLTVSGNEYGYEVLDVRDGTVYGYELVYRAMLDLKADGTFSFASSASDAGFGILQWTDDGYRIQPTAYSELASDGTVYFYHDEAVISNEAFYLLQNAQDSKTAVTWYDFTDAYIEKVLGPRS